MFTESIHNYKNRKANLTSGLPDSLMHQYKITCYFLKCVMLKATTNQLKYSGKALLNKCAFTVSAGV